LVNTKDHVKQPPPCYCFPTLIAIRHQTFESKANYPPVRFSKLLSHLPSNLEEPTTLKLDLHLFIASAIEPSKSSLLTGRAATHHRNRVSIYPHTRNTTLHGICEYLTRPTESTVDQNSKDRNTGNSLPALPPQC
jgi:hypothetical protein